MFLRVLRVQAPVVQTLAIHWITQLVLLVFIRWIVIYQVDSALHRLNNWGQVSLHSFPPCHSQMRESEAIEEKGENLYSDSVGNGSA